MIFAPKMSEIVLEFESFELEPDTQPPTGVFCRYDRLEIWDGFPGGESLERSVAPNRTIRMFETKYDLVGLGLPIYVKHSHFNGPAIINLDKSI